MGNELGLTGEYRYRSTWSGKLILQVQERTQTIHCNGADPREYIIWRDATVSDLQVIEVKPNL